ncbi:cytochrome c oxidase assembly protein COX18, mitochondrial [Bicyclus anynana]|uniref:Cytochrome c oxidase assembly protein COX18, mitochondrial n=1 Tax=Bicyclus anynana TaxID=110368 RepID=A0ABM3LQD7_BICAN|nr:cytochrome c oxidase assembly protein COX18, mitochondrial [Bicyclus anynana]
MNYCIILNSLRSKPFSHLFRSYSIACNNVLDRRRDENSYGAKKYLFNRTTILLPTCNHNRGISIEGIVKWQEQTYNSIANSSAVNVIQDSLLYFHDITGLTWSVTIITSTLLIRTLMTLPLAVYQNYILAKVENIGYELKDLVDELKKETAVAKKMYNLNDKQTGLIFKRSLKKQWRILVERDNCHPLKATMVVWFQIPIWVCMSFALRNLVNMQRSDPAALITLMELQVGGFGWIPNLTEADHSFILPVMFGLTNLAIIEIQRMSKLRAPSRIYNIFTNGFRVFSIIMIPVAATVPSCMCLYWTTSSLFGLAQNLCLLSPSLRRKLKIPESPSELEDPYGHMKQEITQRIKKVLP